MAKRLRKGLRPLVRHIIRDGIREGKSRKEIFEQIEDRYGLPATRGVVDMQREEERRQAAVERIRTLDARKRVNLGELTQCTDANNRVRAYITLHWTDKDTGITYNKGLSVDLDKVGRLSDILNKAIQEVRAYYITKKYEPPEITSRNRSGGAYYRIEYIECV